MAAGSNSLAPARMRSALGSISLRLMPELFRLRPVVSVGIKVDAGEGSVRDLAASTLLVVGDRLWSYVRIAIFGLLILWFTSILAFPVSRVDDENVPSWVRVGVLTLFVMILAILVNYMARPTTRTRALQYLMRGGDYGWLSPLLWAAAIFLLHNGHILRSDSIAVGVEGRGHIRPFMYNALCSHTRQLLQFLHVALPGKHSALQSQ